MFCRGGPLCRRTQRFASMSCRVSPSSRCTGTPQYISTCHPNICHVRFFFFLHGLYCGLWWNQQNSYKHRIHKNHHMYIYRALLQIGLYCGLLWIPTLIHMDSSYSLHNPQYRALLSIFVGLCRVCVALYCGFYM